MAVVVEADVVAMVAVTEVVVVAVVDKKKLVITAVATVILIPHTGYPVVFIMSPTTTGRGDDTDDKEDNDFLGVSPRAVRCAPRGTESCTRTLLDGTTVK